MDNEAKALKMSLDELVNRLSEDDPKMVIVRVQFLEDALDDLRTELDDLRDNLELAFGIISTLGQRQEDAIKHLIWGNSTLALQALRGGEVKNNDQSANPI